MKSRRLILRADACKKIGYGHFIRSLALAGYLNNDFHCEFASFNEDNEFGFPSDYQIDEIAKTCNQLTVIGELLKEYNQNFLKEICRDDIVVLDNYYYDTTYQQSIRDKGCKLVCIDDVHNRHMVCDLLLTPCPLEESDFSLESYTKFCGGLKYAFLRSPFFKPGKNRNVKSKIERVVMAMGGADAFNLTDKMINIIHSTLPDANIDVIAGDTVNISTRNSEIANIYHKLSAEEIVNLFDIADIGIFPASTICIEAISRKLPVIAGFYVDNQKEFYDYGVANNCFRPLGCLHDSPDLIESRLNEIISTGNILPYVIDFNDGKDIIVKLFKDL